LFNLLVVTLLYTILSVCYLVDSNK